MTGQKQMALVTEQERDKSLAPVEPPTINVAAMFERLAANPGMDVEKLDRLIAMQERIMARDAMTAFHAAFAELQAELPAITMRVKGDKWHYAPREHIIAAVKPLLAKHGFSLSHRTEWPDDKTVNVVGILSHRMGHERTSEFKTPADNSGSKNAVQALGSATEYGRRYTTLDLLGIVTQGMDDDAARSQARAEVAAPDGFERWWDGLEFVAKGGLDALTDAWKGSKAEFRDHVFQTNRVGWEKLKAEASKAKPAAARTNGGAK